MTTQGNWPDGSWAAAEFPRGSTQWEEATPSTEVADDGAARILAAPPGADLAEGPDGADEYSPEYEARVKRLRRTGRDLMARGVPSASFEDSG